MSGRATILVVDDHDSLVEAIQTALSPQYDVLSARRGVEAFQVLDHHPVDLVLLDFRLPGLSGLVLLPYFKQSYPTDSVIFMTAYGSERLVQQVIRGGGRDYLCKPFPMVELQETIQRVLRARREGRDARRPILAFPPQGDNRSASETPVLRVLAFLEQNAGKPITLDDVARAVAVSKFYLTRIFREAMGLTVRGFLNRVRVSWATELLLDPTRSITDVALEVGFKDERHFRRVFQKLTGETPSAYRRRML